MASNPYLLNPGAAFAPEEEVLAMGTVDLDGAGPWQAPLPRQWRSRVVLGRAEFNASRLPWTAEALKPGLSAVDGGDFWIGRSEGYPDRSVDGGDFSAGALVLRPFPEVADGGDFNDVGAVTITGAGAYLPGAIVTLSAAAAGNTGDVVWSWDVPPGSGIAGSNAQALTFTMSALRAGTFTVTATSASGSGLPRTAQAMVAYIVPTIGTVSIAGGGRYDNGETVNLKASRSGNASGIAWSWATPVGSGVADSGAANLSFTMSTGATGAYTATATSAEAGDSPKNASANVTPNNWGGPAPTIYLPLRTDLLDASGNGYVSDSPNPPSIGPGSGNNGEGLPILGSGACIFNPGDYLSFANAAELNPGKGPWFFSFMVKWNPPSSDTPIMVSKGYQGPAGAWSHFINASEGVQLSHTIAHGNPWGALKTQPLDNHWEPNTWSRITFSRSGDSLFMMTNSKPVLERYVTNKSFTNTEALRLGSDLATNFFRGEMQDFVYCVGSSLSEAQHDAILTAPYTAL